MSEPTTKGPDEKYCQDCGSIIRAKAEICPKCGVRQLAPPVATIVSPNGKNRTTAGLLALLLGGVGAHKFYLGQPGWGLVYILFCWTLIPTVVSVVEGIILLTMADAAFATKFGGLENEPTQVAQSRFATREEYELWRRSQVK